MSEHKTLKVDISEEALATAHMSYIGDVLHIDRVSLDEIAGKVPTPFYCYSASSIRSAYLELEDALRPTGTSICFAVKANGNLSVLRLLAGLGCGMDIVSGGELKRAMRAGVPANRVIFSGVGKRRNEIELALRHGIHQFNVESADELHLIAEVAQSLAVRAPVALRVNPDVDAATNKKITTGRKQDKFGIAIEEIPDLYAHASTNSTLDVVGLAVHIGSQIIDLSPYRAAYSRMADLIGRLRQNGLSVHRLDLGGGIGIRYYDETRPDFQAFARIVQECVGHLDCELTVEPGRCLVGPAGTLVTELLYTKKTADRITAIVDGGMNDLMRPAIYGAAHPAFAVRHAPAAPARAYQIVGPVCESSDIFGFYDGLPLLAAGDRIAFGCAGAYSASMASTYNARDLPAEVLVDGDRFDVIRRHQTTEDLMALESFPA